MFVRSAYNYDVEAVSDATGLNCPKDEHMTKQEFAEEVDINTILKRFNITGQLPENVRAPVYQDFTEVYDFHSAANAIAQAHEAFDEMPADIRRRFNNDPAEFVAFCSNDSNRKEAEALGLIVPPAVDLDAPPPSSSTAGTPAAPATPAPVPQPGTGLDNGNT